MKTKNNNIIKSLLLGVILLCSALYLSSCSEDDEFGVPSISGIRITDPERKDSTFVQSFRDQLIVIQGQNLGDVTEIYMNNESVYINPAFVTATNIIIGIPEDLPFEGKDPTLPNTIRVVTPGGEASYNFTFLSPPPNITVFKFVPPAVVGKEMQIVGENFYNVLGIVFTDKDSVVTGEVTDFEVNGTFDLITFAIPQGATVDGLGIVVTESGAAAAEYLVNPTPTITGISDDIQMPGATLSIYGKDFTFVNEVIFPGGLKVSIDDADNFKINDLATRIDVTVPLEIAESGSVSLGTSFGVEYSIPGNFFDFSGVFVAFDTVFSDQVGATWEKGTDVDPDGTSPPFFGTGDVHRMEFIADNPWWVDPGTLVLNFNKTGEVGGPVGEWKAAEGISASTPISELALAFNIYTLKPWGTMYWKVRWKNVEANEYIWQPQDVPLNKWVTVKLPLTVLNTGASTWADIVASGSGGDQIFMQAANIQDDPPVEMEVYFDNFRIIKK